MLSKRIEAAELDVMAADGERVAMRLGVSDLARLSELVVVESGSESSVLDAVLKFGAGAEGYPRIRVMVAGELTLRCQRCLKGIALPVRIDTQLTVLSEDEQADQLAEPFDCVVMESGVLVPVTVIEDEILATLPMVPLHEAGGSCARAREPSEIREKQAEQTYRPFEALAAIVGNTQEGNGD